MTESRYQSTAAGLPFVPAQDVKLLNFGGLSIALDRCVPAPRPWTIAQAMWAAELAVHAPPGAILDLCCGPGQIGLLAAKVSERDLLLVDGSPRACRYAERNAVTAELHGRVEVRCGPLEEAVPAELKFPIILADLSQDLAPEHSGLVGRVLGLIQTQLAVGGSAILQVSRRAERVAQAVVAGPAPALRIADTEVYRRGILLELVHA